MVADPSHMSDNSQCAKQNGDETLLLLGAMLGLLGKDVDKLLEASVPEFLVQCYDEVAKTCPVGIPMPAYAGVIGSTYEHEKSDFLISTWLFSPDEGDAYFAKHYPNKKMRCLGIYKKDFCHVHLVDKTEGET